MGEKRSKAQAIVLLLILIAAGVFFWSRGREPQDGAGRTGSGIAGDRGITGEAPDAAVGERGAESSLPEGAAAGPGTRDSEDGEAASAGGNRAGGTGGGGAAGPSPASSIPHKVVRSWGAEGGGSRVPGVVGMYVVVSPHISSEDLLKLSQDLLNHHRGAAVLNVRILDAAEAATYDKHADGGALTMQHVVAEVRRHEQSELESIHIRGVPVDVATGQPLTEKPRTQPPVPPAGN